MWCNVLADKNSTVQDVQLSVSNTRPAKAVYYPYPDKEQAEFSKADNAIKFTVRPFSVHELVVVEF